MKLYFGLAGFAAGTLGFIAIQAAHHKANVAPEPTRPIPVRTTTAPTAQGPTFVLNPAPTATLAAVAPAPPKKKPRRKKTDVQQDEVPVEPVAVAEPKAKPVLRLSTAATGPAESSDAKQSPPSTSPKDDPTLRDLLDTSTPSLSGR